MHMYACSADLLQHISVHIDRGIYIQISPYVCIFFAYALVSKIGNVYETSHTLPVFNVVCCLFAISLQVDKAQRQVSKIRQKRSNEKFNGTYTQLGSLYDKK